MKWKLLTLLLIVAVTSGSFAQVFTAPPTIDVDLQNQSPNPAIAGGVVEVNLLVENIGTEAANDIIITFVPEYPFTLAEGQEIEQTIAYLTGTYGDTNLQVLTYKIKVDRNAIEGSYTITFDHDATRAVWETDSTEFSIRVSSKDAVEIESIDLKKLNPGEETPMTITIRNIGNAPLQNVVFSWNEEDDVILPLTSDNKRYINYLEVGESTSLTYLVIASVNADPDLYKLSLNLEYEVKNEAGVISKETVSTYTGIFVGGETDFDVTFSENTEGTTSLSVANVGRSPALSVTVTVPEQEGYSVIGSANSIVGNLDKGDYTIVSFQITARSTGTATQEGQQRRFRDRTEEERRELTQRRDNNLDVTISYTDTTGVRQTIEKTVPIQFRSALSGQTGQGLDHTFGRRQPFWKRPVFITGLIITLFVIGAAAYYLRIHKKKKGSKK